MSAESVTQYGTDPGISRCHRNAVLVIFPFARFAQNCNIPTHSSTSVFRSYATSFLIVLYI